MAGGDQSWSVDVRRVPRLLIIGAGAFGAINLLLGVLQVLGFDDGGTWFMLFDLNVEGNLPTWYTSAVLALTGLVAALIVQTLPAGHEYRRHWLGIAALFGFLSVDEVAQIHESWNALGRLFGTTAQVVWVVPALILAASLAIVYLRFWLSQEPTVRTLMVVGALLYTLGAVGAELAGFVVLNRIGSGVITGLIVIIEETFEMVGAVSFLTAWLVRLRSLRTRVVLELG